MLTEMLAAKLPPEVSMYTVFSGGPQKKIT